MSFLRFPYLGWRDKLRLVYTTAAAKLRSRDGWEPLEDVSAVDLLVRRYRARPYWLL